MTNAYIYTGDSLTVYIDNVDYNIHESHVNFVEIVEAVSDGDWDSVPDLIDVTAAINVYGQGSVHVVDGEVLYNGTALHSNAVDRVFSMMNLGLPVDPLLNFIENTMENPSYRVVENLYDFLEYGKLPITEDGHFLAWKFINADLTDCYTGKIDNSPGQVVTMDRNKVNEDANVTCSYGLHVCSKEYLPNTGSGYGNRVIVQVKVHPRDVVAIPKDYNNTKMRTCRYEVLQVWTGNNYDYDTPVVDTTSYYHNKRDASGRFVSA